MVQIDPSTLSVKEVYRLMVSAIVPRPIAFISTANDLGEVNLAPYSFFNGISSAPPCLMFSSATSRQKPKKDTLYNIEQTGEFVVNSSNEWMIEPLTHSAAEHPYGVDEMREVGLTPVSSTIVQPPRVKEAAVQFECRLHTLLPIGDGGPGSATIVVGEIVFIHIREDCYENGAVRFEPYQVVGRMGGSSYGRITETFELQIPKIERQKNE
ncbi:flavin reductase family protein [bacterium]|nr:flavin reductase family protein [bacterium]